jgi:hypothetical protein
MHCLEMTRFLSYIHYLTIFSAHCKLTNSRRVLALFHAVLGGGFIKNVQALF